jgi:high-affinity nickel permease
MDILKKSLMATVLLLVVVVAWVVASVYFKQSYVDVNPNATSYTRQIKNSFDTDALETVTQRTEKSFSVSPSEFLNLTEGSN